MQPQPVASEDLMDSCESVIPTALTNTQGDKDSPDTVGTKWKLPVKWSRAWEHMDPFECPIDKIQKAKCRYCNKILMAASKKGISSLLKHCDTCPNRPSGSQKNLQYQKGQLTSTHFDHNTSLELVCEMLMVDEMPFIAVEKPGLRKVLSYFQPNFKIPTRRTAARKCYEMYLSEKKKLMSFIKEHSQRVSIITDTWTSLQNRSYMCLTVHFIDDERKLQKRILNFCPVSSHKGEELGKDLAECLNNWGIVNLFTVTVDNASANDKSVDFLRKKFDGKRNGSILNGKYMHMRCIAHILNLVVRDGLEGIKEDNALTRIRGVIKYVKGSVPRSEKLKNLAVQQNVDSKKVCSLDVATQWNSTYMMLETAVTYRRAFETYALEDRNFREDNETDEKSLPESDDWEIATNFVKFLARFYHLTVTVSGSSHVTSNLVFGEIYKVDRILTKWLNSDDRELKTMALSMKVKYDKYWGPVDKMNFIIYYVVVLDPRCKWQCIEFTFGRMYPNSSRTTSSSKEKPFIEVVKEGLREMFDEYNKMCGQVNSTSSIYNADSGASSSSMINDVNDDLDEADDFRKVRRKGTIKKVQDDLQKYLEEDVETYEKLDVLEWWKRNALRFPVLSKQARDVLGAPVTSVASESAFSTGGRIFNEFRCSLSPKTAQALICAQDWLRPNCKPIKVEEDMEQLELLDKELHDDHDTTILKC